MGGGRTLTHGTEVLNDREYRAQQKRIITLSKKWERPIGATWFTITHCIERGLLPEQDGEGEAWQAVARCHAKWQYRSAQIVWSAEAAANCDDDELETVFVHELMHVFLDEISTPEKFEHEERVAETLARGFRWVREAGYDEGYRAAKKEAA